jgi:hypothetical protein
LSAAIGPVGAAIGAVSAAVLLGIKRLEDHESQVRKNAEAIRKLSEESDAFYRAEENRRQKLQADEESRRGDFGGLRIGSALTPEGRRSRLAAELARLGQQRAGLEGQASAIEARLAISPHAAGGFSDPTLELRRRASLDPVQYSELLGLSQRRHDTARAEHQLGLDSFRIQKDILDTQRRGLSEAALLGIHGAVAGVGGGLLGAVGTLGAGQAGGQLIAGFDREVAAMRERAQRALDELVGIMEASARRARDLEQALRNPQ